jgi:hypothetical protein
VYDDQVGEEEQRIMGDDDQVGEEEQRIMGDDDQVGEEEQRILGDDDQVGEEEQRIMGEFSDIGDDELQFDIDAAIAASLAIPPTTYHRTYQWECECPRGALCKTRLSE